jgi:hypothetical protein
MSNRAPRDAASDTQRTHLIAAAVLAHRNGGYHYVSDEGHRKGPIHPTAIPDDAIDIIAPGPVVVRAGQYLRRLRRLANTARKDR